MFNFENWSKQVFHLTSLLEETESALDKEKINKYQSDLQKLWDEMIQHEDEGVRFLKKSLKMSEQSLEGDLSEEKLKETMDAMRSEAIEKSHNG
ncbi:hypothetical protein [Alkalihalobacillus deserti]|uniref:hypothetical protein n=1 Tax=Alkalihalobacillus deserti TaxID=2879466 RepID=UPI001D15BB86|nr:hypothetical protein [Alkalihalobacillus deserti]